MSLDIVWVYRRPEQEGATHSPKTHSPWGCRTLILTLYFFSSFRPCYSLHCGGSCTTISVERVCEASGSDWLWSGANWDGASTFTRCPVWNGQTLEATDGPCCNCGAHQLRSQPNGAEWLQWSYSRGFAKSELSSTLQFPQSSLIFPFALTSERGSQLRFLSSSSHSPLPFYPSLNELLETAAAYAGRLLCNHHVSSTLFKPRDTSATAPFPKRESTS